MPLNVDVLRANFFDLKNSINRLINGDLEPLKGFGINFLNKGETTRNPQKTLFKFLAGVSTTIAAVATAFRVFVLMKTTV